jgi:hypothetical protein
VDDSTVKVTEHSKLVIDDFVYDPKNKDAGKLALNMASGTARYASGAIATIAAGESKYDYLTSNGIDAARLNGPTGYGESRPLDTNDSADGRAKNRRTELNVQN